MLVILSVILFSGCHRTVKVIKIEREEQEVENPLDFLQDDEVKIENKKLNEELTWENENGMLINNTNLYMLLDALPLEETNPPLYASYNDVGFGALPSIEMVKAKSKYFNDRFYATLDYTYIHGLGAFVHSIKGLFKDIYSLCPQNSDEQAFVAAGLEFLTEIKELAGNRVMINAFQKEFLVQAVYSKPLGFYNWTEELQELWRFMRYFQMQYSEKDKLTILLSIGKLIHEDTLYNTEERLKEVIYFYSHLTNPPNGITLVDIIERGIFRIDDLNLTALSGELNRSLPLVSLLSISNSPEALLFNKLNTRGVDLTTIDLMQVFIEAIQSGEVDLSLKPDSGWYDYMVYALETLVLPKRGPENRRSFIRVIIKNGC